MNDYDKYSKCIVRSVGHIFKNFLDDSMVEEVYTSQSSSKDHKVAVEIEGTIQGELVINLPDKTLALITKKFINKSDIKLIKKSYGDVAGELANLITGTFANQLQYSDHEILLSPPEFNYDLVTMKALYENINLSFNSKYGGFDIDLYYKNSN
jgi:CheY-specific phosphatase CheX